MKQEYYDGMVKWISRHCIREHYGTYHINGQFFEGFRVVLQPNGFDMMPVFHRISRQLPDTETEDHFWEENTVDSLIGFEGSFWADIVFDRFEDWQSRAIFKTEDGIIHVRFEMQKPMDGLEFLDWVKTLGHRVDLLTGPRGPLYTIPFYGDTTATYTHTSWGEPEPSKHDWTPRHDRVDRYNSGSYSDYDEWCDYLDEVCGRD